MTISRPSIPHTLLLIAGVAGPFIGIAVKSAAVGAESDRMQRYLERRVAAAAFAIEREVVADLEVLYALRSWFDIGPPVTRLRFAVTARPFLDRHPTIRALEWAPRIARSDRQRHSQDARGDGLAGYSINERLATGEMAAAGERDWYYPVTFVEPVEGNERVLGFDLGSDRLRREAMERAAATGQPTLTDPISLVQGRSESTGMLAFLAVFGEGSASAAPQDSQLRGFVVTVFDINDLLQQALLELGGANRPGIHFELIDDDLAGRSSVIRWPGGSPDSEGDPEGSVEHAIDIGGQHWRVVARPSAAHLRSLQTHQPLLLGVTAAIAWELLVGLIVIVGKRSHDRLERRHARLINNILESLSDGVIVADTSGRILTANRAAIRMTGQGGADIPPSAWSETFGLFVPGTGTLFPPDELPLARAIRGEATDSVEVLVRNLNVPDGAFVSVSGSPMLNSRGSVRGGVAVFRDITEQKRAEERLRRLSSAVEQTADSVLITNSQGTIEYVNPAFEDTTGYSSAEVVGRNPNILKSGVQSQDYYRQLWSTILRGEPFRGTTVNRKKNGDLYFAEQTITAIKDTNGGITHFVSVLKDMTERRKLQEQEIEMELAAKVQRRLFPSAPPQLPGYDLAGAVFPAEATSGDYFDFVPMANDGLAIVVADVTGHGVGPALVMAQTRAYLHSLARTTDDLASIAAAINRFLVADLEEELFVTMLLARLEASTGRLAYVNSGHPCGYIVGRSGEVTTQLDSTCIPLGIFLERWRCEGREVQLDPGELAVLVTDGVLESESPHGDEFGAERLLEIVREHRQQPAREIVKGIYKAVREFAHEEKQIDDITIVICKRH